MREQDIQVMENRLSELTHQLQDVQREMEGANSKLRETYAQEVRKLEVKRRRASALLAQLRLKEAESWEEENLQTGLFRILDDIGIRLNRVMTRRH